MKRVIIESPYAGHIRRNLDYARECLRHSIDLGESPLASHLLYTQILDDSDAGERTLGIEAGLAWYTVAEAIIFYTDYGMSPGMKRAYEYALEMKHDAVFRKIRS